MKWASMVLIAVLTGCATLGVPQAKTFNQKVLAVQVGLNEVLALDTQLITQGTVSSQDGENIQKQADNIEQSIGVARSLYGQNQTAGTAKIDSAVMALQALETYLQSREKK